MRNLIALVFASGALATFAGCDIHVGSFGGWSDADLTAATNIAQTAEIPSTLANLDVENSMGAVRVTGVENGSPRWTWKLAVRARTDEAARRIAAAVKFEPRMEGNRLTLAVVLPETREPHSIRSDFEITVPKKADVRTETHFDRTDISGIAGDVEAAGQNGAVEIQHVLGHVRARTSFANLTVADTGPATLKNQNGEIHATHIAGALEAETSFDKMIIEDAGQATLRNQNGAIDAVRIGGPLDARTSFDWLSIRDIEGRATLANQNGSITADRIHGMLDANTSFGPIEARDIGGAVRARNQNGNVTVANAKGDADIKTSFCPMNVDGVEGNAILLNQNGEITASGITGSVEANTSFAPMEIRGSGSRFACHNQNGAVRLRAISSGVTDVEASTSFDALELHLPAGVKPAILARTSLGEVESDFPVLAKAQGEEAFAGVDPGGLRARLHNQNGNIRVVRD